MKTFEIIGQLPESVELVARLYRERDERACEYFISLILKKEGKWPGLEAIQQHATRAIYPDGKQEFKWRNEILLTIPGCPAIFPFKAENKPPA